LSKGSKPLVNLDPHCFDDLTPENELALVHKLRAAKLRSTKQRIALAHLLYRDGDRHLTAEMLYADAKRVELGVSLATVYNTLNQFLEAGLLREVIVDSSRSYFDTNIGQHHHFYVEATGELIDVPAQSIAFSQLPETPTGYDIDDVDVVVRLKQK
jgi:Fur family iron response transcriptional regulator